MMMMINFKRERDYKDILKHTLFKKLPMISNILYAEFLKLLLERIIVVFELTL